MNTYLFPIYAVILGVVIAIQKFLKDIKLGPFKLPMITYPDCQACDCGDTYVPPSISSEERICVAFNLNPN